jgi:hypothetical protein
LVNLGETIFAESVLPFFGSAVRKVVLGLPARRDASLPRAALYMRAEIGLDRIQFAIQRSSALNAQRKTRGEAELSTPEFMKLVRETSKHLGIDQEMLRRAVNVGFSGGEKKRNEILQMAVLQPRLAVLRCSASPSTSNKIIQIGLAFSRRQSGSVSGSRRWLHFGILPRRLVAEVGFGGGGDGRCTTEGDPDDQRKIEPQGRITRKRPQDQDP